MIYLELEDLLRRFDARSHLTGVPRVSMRLAVAAATDDRFGFCRMSRLTGRLIAVHDADVARTSSTQLGGDGVGIGRVARFAAGWSRRAASDLGNLAGLRRGQPAEISALVAPGATWDDPRYASTILRLKQRRPFLFVPLVHDVIPLTHPAFALSARHRDRFRRWLHAIAALSDVMLTPSDNSRREIEAYGRRNGLRLPPIKVIPYGSEPRAGRSVSGRDPAEPFVLIVGTLEIRKNHALAVEVWRRLIVRHGFAKVPTLVMAGRLGWGVEPLLATLRESAFLGGKVQVRSGVSDDMLDALYGQCLFTLFPSKVEGYGLPVSESLARGTFCLASDAASLKEIGGDLIDYFDPSDVDGALAAIETALFDTAYLEKRKARLQAEYRPSNWSATLDHIASCLAELR